MKTHSLPLRAATSAVLLALGSFAGAQTVQNTTTSYQYDANGNLTRITDPLNHVTVNQYDALNRRIKVTDPNNGITQYGYTGLDQLTQVTDPRALVTRYSIDGLNNLTQLQSPDTGTTTHTYDAAGNLLTRTDAKGQTTSYQYDVLNRITLISYADGNTIAYQYDQGTNGIGRLSRITDNSGSIQYSYDAHGRVVSEVRSIGGQQYTTAYRYDSAGRLAGLTYPSGRSIDYVRDGVGRISQITATQAGVTQPLATQVSYRPFGPVQAVTFGNNRTYQRAYDLDGRISSYTLNNQAQALSYDAASRITAVADTGNAANSASYGYDILDRLTQTILPTTAFGYTYDANGNRTSQTTGGNSRSYQTSTTSNRLTSISTPSRTFTYDANGSVVNDNGTQLTYDAKGRMSQSIGAAGTVQYQVDALGSRIRKTSGSDDRIFHYDRDGHLIAESTAAGTVLREFVYLDDIPLAVLQGSAP